MVPTLVGPDAAKYPTTEVLQERGLLTEEAAAEPTKVPEEQGSNKENVTWAKRDYVVAKKEFAPAGKVYSANTLGDTEVDFIQKNRTSSHLKVIDGRKMRSNKKCRARNNA